MSFLAVQRKHKKMRHPDVTATAFWDGAFINISF